MHRHLARICALAGAMLWSLTSQADVTTQEEGICLQSGDQRESIGGCAKPVDTDQIRRTAGRFWGSSLGADISSVHRDAAWQASGKLGHQWNASRFGDPYISLYGGWHGESAGLAGSFYLGDTYRELSTASVAKLPAAGFYVTGGGAEGTLVLGDKNHVDSSYIAFAGSAIFQTVKTGDSIHFQSKDTFDNAAASTAERQPAEDAFMRGSAVASGSLVSGTHRKPGARFDFQLRVRGARGSSTGSYAGIDGFSEVAARPGKWLEFGATGRFQYASTPNAPVFVMPSLGGGYGMHSVPDGTLIDPETVTIMGSMGHPMLKFFVEHGRALTDEVGLTGGGFEFSLNRALTSAAGIDRFPAAWVRRVQILNANFVLGYSERPQGDPAVSLLGTVVGLIGP